MTTPWRRAAVTLSETAAQTLLEACLADGFCGVLPYAVVQELAGLERIPIRALMLKLVKLAQVYAITPISHFEVGAVAQGSTTGNLYLGANMEFPGQALSFSVHAEQSAMTNAWLNDEHGLSGLAVGAAPCGGCRQYLYELTTADALEIVLADADGRPISTKLPHLLPSPFGPGDLGITSALMTPQAHGLILEESPTGQSAIVALAAANASYAPYSGGFAGVALTTRSGALYAGRYAESAAYNPSMLPLESALAMWSLCGEEDDAPVAVTLVERESLASQEDAARAVLRSVAPNAPLRVLRAHE
jgi:cytidine deaminase